MRHSGSHEQQSLPAASGRRCQLLACASLTETARRPLLARTSAFIGQHDGTLSASWLGSPHAASRVPCGRRQACRRQAGKVTAVAGTREPPRAKQGYQIEDNFRLPDSQRKEYQDRVAERRARAGKPLPGSPEATAITLVLKSTLPAYVKDSVLMMGLSVYWDLTEVAAKAEYTWDWEATELPMELFFRQGMSEEHVQSARAKWFNSVCGLALRTRAAENRGKKKSEATSKGLASLATPKGFGGAAAPKGFGGGEAKPSRGRKKKGAAPAAKKLVKSQDALLYELEMKTRAREREREQQAWSQYVAWLESFFGPMSDDDVADYLSQKALWDVADDLFGLAVGPAIAAGLTGCSMEYCVRLLRSLRFAFVVVFAPPMRLKDRSEALEAPEQAKVSPGQNLLSGVGTALRDALTFRKGPAAAPASNSMSLAEADAALMDARKLSRQEREQSLLDMMEAVDREGVPAELTEAAGLRRIFVIEELLTPGFRWWQERGERLLGEAAPGMPEAAPNFPMAEFPEEALLGRAAAPEGPPAAAVSGMEDRDKTESSTLAVCPVGDESAQPSDHSLEATQAHQASEEPLLGGLQEGSEPEAVQTSSGASEQPADALQASMQAAEQAAEQLQATIEQSQEASLMPDTSSQLLSDASQQPSEALEPLLEAPETTSEAADQSLNGVQTQGPPEQSPEVLQQQIDRSQPALQGSEQALRAFDQSRAALQQSLGLLDRQPLEAAEPSAETSERVSETSQQAEAQGARPGPTPGAQQVRRASGQLGRTSEPPELPKQAPAEDVQAPDGDRQGSSGGWSSSAERPADASQPNRPQPVSPLMHRFRDSAEELARLEASAMGPRARRPPAARAKQPRSRDGWTSLPEQAPEREPERLLAPARAPAAQASRAAARASAPSAPAWQPRIRVQPPAFHEGAYMAPQLLPGDRHDWKAAGVLAYTVDEYGIHLLLGKIERLSYSPIRASEKGWWILGGKRSGADYSAEATAVREMFEETAGLLSGRDVSGGQLSEVLWYPDAGYALFPLYIPGKPNIPRAYIQKMAERERFRRRTVRRVAAGPVASGPRPMSKLGWVPLQTIMERRCKTHLVLEAMIRKTSLISYLQQMQQLIGEQARPQAHPMTHPPGASYGGPTPLVPKNYALALPQVEGGRSPYSRGSPPRGENPSASRGAGAATEQRSTASPARVHLAASDDSGTSFAEAPSTNFSAASVNGSAADERRASPQVEGGSSPYSRGSQPRGEGSSASRWAGAATEQRGTASPARAHPAASYESGTSSAEAPSTASSAASVNGSAADKRRLSPQVEGGSSPYSRGSQPRGEGSSASRWAGADTEQRGTASPARVHPAASYESGTSFAEAPSTASSAASVNGSAADEHRPSAVVARAASGSHRRREDPRPAQAGPKVYQPSAASTSPTSADSGSRTPGPNAGGAAGSAAREGVPPRELAEHATRAAGREELREADSGGSKAQREVPPWERDLHAPKPYKPAIIRRGRRRLKRRAS